MLEIQVVSNQFPSIAAAFSGAVADAVDTVAFQIEADAKDLVPVDTGHLKGSIQAQPSNDGLSAAVNVFATYAAYVEFGTSRMRAQPYLVPAVEMNRPRLEASLGMLERML